MLPTFFGRIVWKSILLTIDNFPVLLYLWISARGITGKIYDNKLINIIGTREIEDAIIKTCKWKNAASLKCKEIVLFDPKKEKKTFSALGKLEDIFSTI